MKKDELEKLGFELSDLVPRLEMIQHASEAVTTLNKRTKKYTQTTLKSDTELIFNHRDVITTKGA